MITITETVVSTTGATVITITATGIKIIMAALASHQTATEIGVILTAMVSQTKTVAIITGGKVVSVSQTKTMAIITGGKVALASQARTMAVARKGEVISTLPATVLLLWACRTEWGGSNLPGFQKKKKNKKNKYVKGLREGGLFLKGRGL